MMGEEKRDEYGDIVGGPKISKNSKQKIVLRMKRMKKLLEVKSM